MDLTDRTALVTGANRGIGRALCEALAARPLRLVLAGVRDPDAFEPIAGRAEVRPVRMDLSSREAIDACADALDEDVDLLVNNAGQMTGGLLEEQDMDAVYAMFQVNLIAVAHLTSRVLPGMLARGRGTVVNNASISGYAYFPAASTYAASKAGVVALTESLRRELDGTGVRALHVVTPGREHRHARRHRGGLRPLHGHLGLGQGRAGGVGGEGARRRRGGQVDRRPRRAPVGGEARLARPVVPRRRDQRPDVQPAAAALATGGASASASIPASGLASTVWTSPIRRSAKPASQ